MSHGGQVTLRGKLQPKGPLAPSRVAIAFAAEGLARRDSHNLSLLHNTVVMTRPISTFLRASSGIRSFRLPADVLASPDSAELISGSAPLVAVRSEGQSGGSSERDHRSVGAFSRTIFDA